MALIVPTSFSTFGDATSTEGGRLSKYVLAQFRSDASLAWVAELRAHLVTAELKYKAFRENRAKLRLNRELWRRIEAGVAQATLVVIDPEPVAGVVRDSWESRGAQEGIDFTQETLTNGCATALVAGTPIAYLPSELATVEGWQVAATLDRFSPDAIQKQIGPSLKSAKVFAARAHATFDVARRDATATSTRDVFRSPLAHVILVELLSTQRVFDKEHEPAARVLNDASDAIAKGMSEHFRFSGELSQAPLVREEDSRSIDHLQAADMAAGWAREAIDTGGLRSLGAQFERVWVNGRLLKGTHE